MASSRTLTYHCICNELAVATCGPLEDMPKRSCDSATICPMSNAPLAGSIVLSSSCGMENEATVLKLKDGFEKRYGVKCGRCDLQVGYILDKASFGEGSSGRIEDVVYLLPGGLMSTIEMREGKDMSKEIELIASAAG